MIMGYRGSDQPQQLLLIFFAAPEQEVSFFFGEASVTRLADFIEDFIGAFLPCFFVVKKGIIIHRSFVFHFHPVTGRRPGERGDFIHDPVKPGCQVDSFFQLFDVNKPEQGAT